MDTTLPTPPTPLAACFRYWGKARPAAGSAAQFHLLPYHCLDVAAVGVEALRRIPALRTLLTGRLGLEGGALEGWVGFWLAVHDLGKFSEAFQSQRADIFQRLRARPPAKPYRPRHDSVGMLFWADVLARRVHEEKWFGPDTVRFVRGLHAWARAVTGHHGQSPKEGDDWRQHYDQGTDCAPTLAFVAEARRLFLDDEVMQGITRLGAERFYDASAELSWWIAGLAVLADWLGSNTVYFEYRDRVDTRLGCVFDDDVLMVEGYTQQRGKNDDLRFSSVDFSGEMTITDAAAFTAALMHGVGHAKAFGCGLLLVKPLR